MVIILSLNYYFMCVDVLLAGMFCTICMPGIQGSQKRTLATETGITDSDKLLWILGIEPRSYARTASVLNPRAISPAQNPHF